MTLRYRLHDGMLVNNLKDIGQSAATLGRRDEISPPDAARRLHEQGRQLGSQPDYVGAAACFKQACTLAPQWAYPRYDLAFTELLQGHTQEALENYEAVDRLRPDGFFTAKTAIWALTRERSGRLPANVYAAYVLSEALAPAQRLPLMQQITQRAPSFAPAWKALYALDVTGADRKEYLLKALALDPDPETYGICTINLASHLSSRGHVDDAKTLLMELLSGQQTTAGMLALAMDVLKTL